MKNIATDRLNESTKIINQLNKYNTIGSFRWLVDRSVSFISIESTIPNDFVPTVCLLAVVPELR